MYRSNYEPYGLISLLYELCWKTFTEKKYKNEEKFPRIVIVNKITVSLHNRQYMYFKGFVCAKQVLQICFCGSSCKLFFLKCCS